MQHSLKILIVVQIGLSASTIASSFGKVIQENKDLSDYRREDIALSLLRMISYNIGQVGWKMLFDKMFQCPLRNHSSRHGSSRYGLGNVSAVLSTKCSSQVAYLNALRYGLKRIFFGGFFIRGHAYTMDTMSFAIRFW